MSTGSLSSLCAKTDLESEVTSTADTVENTDVKIQKSNLEYEQLTEEEKRRHKKICEKIERLYATATKKTCTDKHFKCLDHFVYTLGKIRKSHFYFQDFPLKICDDSKQKAGADLAESGFALTVCDFLVEGLKTERYAFDDSRESDSKLWYEGQKEAFAVIWGFTDCSREVGRVVNDHKYLLPLLVGKLWEWYETFMGKVKNERINFFVRATLAIFHNIAMHDVIEKLRELQASLILVKYLKSESIDEKVITAATLAEVMTDEEADSLIASSDVASFLLRLLKNALRAKDHRYYSFSVTELVRASLGNHPKSDGRSSEDATQSSYPMLGWP